MTEPSNTALAPWIQRQLGPLLAQRGHAWLLQGPSGLGQYPLALALVRAWLCEAPSAEQGACGHCGSCHAIDVRTHADLCVLMPETEMLALGWPLAVPVFCLIAVLVGLIAPVSWAQQLDMALWLGIVPATLSFGLGMALRRWVWKNLFVYILGRAFLGTALCMFVSGALAQWTGHRLAATVDPDLAMVARWLIAWGDAFMTGMMAAICVAFKPHWLATWSDRLYVAPPRQPS